VVHEKTGKQLSKHSHLAGVITGEVFGG